MGGYSKSGPFVNNSSPGITATFLNNVESVLSRGTGDTETGKYFIAGPLAASGNVVAAYVPSISRSATPSSVTIDEADQGHIGGMNTTPSTNFVTSNGFQVFNLSTTGPAPNARAGGNYTLHYALLLIAVPLITLAGILGPSIHI